MEGQEEHLYFREKQHFSPWVFILLILVFALVAVVARTPVSVLVVIGAVTLDMRLSTEVDSDRLRVRFFPFARREILLDRIAHWEARTYEPIREYGGWGIRMGRSRGDALNARGNRGVQLRFTDGEELLVGSQRPEELANAITRAKSRDRSL